MRTNTQITTLGKPDGSLTKDTKETLRHMLEYFTPEDKELGDNNHHKEVGDTVAKPPNTPEDREFTREGIRKVLEGMNNKKARTKTG